MELTQELLNAVIDIAHVAGDRILEVYATDFSVISKDDASPLTQADLAAHRSIVDALAALTPEIPVLSEEGAGIAFETRAGWTRYWLVDPLDGTKEFVKRNGEFTVNIALIEDHVPALGVVYAPVLNTTYAGARGLGALRMTGAERAPMTTRAFDGTPMFVVSRSHRDAETDAMLTRFPGFEAISKGSSLKFCLVASGEADMYPRTGPTSEWDTAAGQCVVESAGGLVLRLPDYQPLRYNTKDSLLNPGFVVIGDPGFDWVGRLTA